MGLPLEFMTFFIVIVLKIRFLRFFTKGSLLAILAVFLMFLCEALYVLLALCLRCEGR